jgi:hypothetical protein
MGVAWSQLFNAAIAANCHWRLWVEFPEYIEGGGKREKRETVQHTTAGDQAILRNL